MHTIFKAGIAALTMIALHTPPVYGDSHNPTEKNDSDIESHSASAIAAPREFVTEHSGTFNGAKLRYRARAGETYLRDEEGKPSAAIFSFDYVAISDGKDRPVTFVWNGGPGSASLWLHMGTFGPKRVVVPSGAGHAGAPPFPLVASSETILDVTDLVFIDPVGTGYSRALGEHDGKEFWGLKEDAESISAFIRRWLSDNQRWNSPKFLLGESYGTTRAALVADILENEHSVALNGIVFISQALDYAGSTPYVADNLISHITYVPTMAATAYYHQRVDARGASLEEWVQQARDFAVDELLPALFKGNTLDADTRARVRDELARLTGLSPEYVEQANLRVRGTRFAKELLRDEGKIVGSLDARYLGDPVDDLTARADFDAASNAISGAYTAALMSYMQSDLAVVWERPYLSPADPRLSDEWNWNPKGRDAAWEPHWVNTSHNLVSAMEANPGLRVLVASGYYDLVTPFFDAEYTLNRYGITPDRVDYKYYGGGHMMYVNEEARLSLLSDVRAFLKAQLR
ncbi:S10 family peptidase [Congregibacter litoralis]|uniref:Carboxypeptidase C (Cathepsin A) n=1 Tax=Congregibacter litoralis KT71 TaxID=314285 RepID=A4A440_9GAMM|nr:septum formation initiator [Congregibacter litoralis]EAQ99463.1 Carboxypeptidase C (cathepsin A) [Congregibacter litoralis KT71]